MKLAIVITEDWYVASHRLPVIREAVAAGWQVTVLTRVRDHGTLIENAGADVVSLPLAREGRHPMREREAFKAIQAVYRDRRPDVVHHVGMKPILYGGWAARLGHRPGVVQAFAGLGYLYTSCEQRARVRRWAVETALRPTLRGSRTRILVQNGADRDLLIAHHLVPAAAVRVVAGSGVDLTSYRERELPTGPPLVVLPARLLADKGVNEFVQAARLLRGRARFALVGAPDPANPATISPETVSSWMAEGLVEVWGHRRDMPEVLAQASIVVLPSYREGMPKALLEAAATGRPIVTTRVPGCEDVVEHEVNGLLIPVRDTGALAAAIARLLDDEGLARRLGHAGRVRAERDFSDVAAARATVDIYHELLP